MWPGLADKTTDHHLPPPADGNGAHWPPCSGKSTRSSNVWVLRCEIALRYFDIVSGCGSLLVFIFFAESSAPNRRASRSSSSSATLSCNVEPYDLSRWFPAAQQWRHLKGKPFIDIRGTMRLVVPRTHTIVRVDQTPDTTPVTQPSLSLYSTMEATEQARVRSILLPRTDDRCLPPILSPG